LGGRFILLFCAVPRVEFSELPYESRQHFVNPITLARFIDSKLGFQSSLMELETKYKPIDLVIAHGCLLLPQIHFCFRFAALRLSFIDAHQLGLDLSGERDMLFVLGGLLSKLFTEML